LQVRDLFPDPPPSWNGRELADIYSYRDEYGTVLCQKVRWLPKNFTYRSPDGSGGWKPEVGNAAEILYRLPELVAAVKAGETVYFVEGEKDANRLASIGLAATTTRTAGKLPDGSSEILRNVDVVILPDNDDPGRKAAEKIAKGLDGLARTIRVVRLPDLPESGDVTDWLMAGGTREALEELVALSPPRSPVSEVEPVESISASGLLIRHDLVALMADPPPEPKADLLVRTDGVGILLRGTVSLIIGEPGTGKSWITLEAVRQCAHGGELAVVLDYEGTAWSYLRRFLNLGGTEQGLRNIAYYNPGPIPFASVFAEISLLNPALVVIDSAAASYADLGLDEDRGKDALQLLRGLARPLARKGAAVLVVDHVVKAPDARGRWPRGHGAKLGEVDLALVVKPRDAFSRGASGRLNLVISKEREGMIGGMGAVAGMVQFMSNDHSGRLAIVIDPPGAAHSSGSAKMRPSEERVLAVLLAADGPLTAEELEIAVAKDGKGRVLANRTIQAAAKDLVEHGRADSDEPPKNEPIRYTAKPPSAPSVDFDEGAAARGDADAA
jgi:hypothetical protein